MSKRRVVSSYGVTVLLLSSLLGLGCSSSTTQILTSANAYHYHHSRYSEQCVGDHATGAPNCAERFHALQDWRKYLEEAEEAVERGGKLPLQLHALEAVEKRLK